MIFGLQVIGLVFSLIMLYFAYVHYRRGEINGLEIIFWLVAWIGAILIIIFPQVFGVFAKTIAISRAFDLAVIGGFIFVIPLVYLSYMRVKRLERKLEEYVRQESLRDAKKQK